MEKRNSNNSRGNPRKSKKQYLRFSEQKVLSLHESTFLKNSELISLITGIKDFTIIQNILNSTDNSLKNLSLLSPMELIQHKGIGHSKAMAITASFELSKRLAEERSLKLTSIKNSMDIKDFMSGIFTGVPHEEFHIIYLNHGHKIIRSVKHTQGGINQTTVDVRLIIRTALTYNSTVIVLSHNHPSGNVNPSNEDIKITQTVKNACKIMDITVLDHVIVTDNAYYSFADEGIL